MNENKWLLRVKYNNVKYDIEGNLESINKKINESIEHIDHESEEEHKNIKLVIGANASKELLTLVDRKKSNKGIVVAKDKLDVVTFIQSLGPRIEWVYALGFAYYLQTKLNQPHLTARMILNLYEQIAIHSPKNIHLCINQCIKKGLLVETGKAYRQKTYRVSEEGLQFIERQSKSNQDIQTEIYETPEQKKIFTSFLKNLTESDRMLLNNTNTLEEKLLVLLHILQNSQVPGPYRSAPLHQCLIDVFGYQGIQRSVQLGLNRARPYIRKVKIASKVYYELSDQGREHLQRLIVLK